MSSSGSDSGDEDYVPSDCSQPPSEVESDGDEEESDACDEDAMKNGHKDKKKAKKLKNGKESEEPPEEKPETEDSKKKSESLWSDFLKDVSQDGSSKGDSLSESGKPKAEKKIITEVYEFAGEKVSVSKEVDSAVPAKIRKISTEKDGSVDSLLSEKNSHEQESMPKASGDQRDQPVPGVSRKSTPNLPVTKPNARVGGSILGSALDKLGKKNKLSTLEKSKLDWESYKNKEGISEEITAHNKGKSGFLDKRDFLEKADLKQYELEKQMRNSLRRKF